MKFFLRSIRVTVQPLSKVKHLSVAFELYMNRWRICGVVSAKEDLREFKTARRDMKVFNFELTDDEGSCIRIAAFDDLAEKFYALVQKSMVVFYVFKYC